VTGLTPLALVAMAALAAPPELDTRLAPDTVVTRFLQIGDAPLEPTQRLLEHFGSDGADITLHTATRTLVVTDTRRNIARMEGLLRAVDAPDSRERIYIRPNPAQPGSPAGDVQIERAELVQRVLSSAGDEAVVVPDERTGQVIVITSRRNYERLDRLMRRLDRAPPARGGSGRGIHILHLNHADAKDLQPILDSIMGSRSKGGSKRGSRRKSSSSRHH
jgi:general secretion pathway protein D